MDPIVLAAIASAVGVVVAAFFGYVGVRGSNRRQAQQEQRDADLNRLRAVIDEMAEDNERTRARAARAEERTEDCEAREEVTRQEMARMRQTMEALLVREERREHGR